MITFLILFAIVVIYLVCSLYVFVRMHHDSSGRWANPNPKFNRIYTWFVAYPAIIPLIVLYFTQRFIDKVRQQHKEKKD